LEEIRCLTGNYPPLRRAQHIVLLWDGTNRESRYDPNGNVNKLWRGLENIFMGREIDEVPYDGALDWAGLHVDKGTLILPQDDKSA
jgi:hypothetical protein